MTVLLLLLDAITRPMIGNEYTETVVISCILDLASFHHTLAEHFDIVMPRTLPEDALRRRALSGPRAQTPSALLVSLLPYPSEAVDSACSFASASLHCLAISQLGRTGAGTSACQVHITAACAGQFRNQDGSHRPTISVQQVPPWPQAATNTAAGGYPAPRDADTLHRSLPEPDQVCIGSLASWAPG